MKRLLILTLIAAFAATRAAAEPDSLKSWTLNDCLDYALEHNIQLRQSRNDYLSGIEDTKEARAALFPSLTASTSQGLTNYPSSNATDRNSYTGTYGLEAGMTLYNGLTRNEFRLSLDGENCETHLLGMGIADDDRRIDTLTLIDHNVPRCRSNELYKYSADDRSRCSFAGRILVRPGAHHTDSYQSNRNLLGSSDARIYSKPQLEIYNDDVKCSHGSASGQLDAMQLFYMRTRGIPEKEARTMLMQAFMVDVIDTVGIPGLHDRLLRLVDKRFSGETGCSDCNTCKEP